MYIIRSFLIAFLLLAAISGCATSPIIDGATPKSISIRYDQWLVSATQATETAQNHCLAYGKNAELTSRNQFGGGWMVMNFRCAD